MSPSPTPVTAQVQRQANDITARLAQLAKDPPELLVYLRVHADCIAQSLRPAGMIYFMQSGSRFQRVLLSNVESLNYKNAPEQENAFERAVKTVAEKGNPLFLEPNTLPSDAQHGVSVEDSPAPEELPVFNRTPYQQIFTPIPLGKNVVGVVHAWFPPAPPPAAQLRIQLLRQICGEVELYLKARRLTDISQELTRLGTYTRLLEDLSGDNDIESVSWNIVNYARETVSCDRVCLFIAKDYGQLQPTAPTLSLEYDFELHACSGLKRPHPRSEQAVILNRLAQKLTQLSLERTRQITGEHNPTANLDRRAPAADAETEAEAPPAANAAINGAESGPVPTEAGAATPDRNGAAPSAKEEAAEEEPAPEKRPQIPTRPRIQLTVIKRDPAKAATRPPEVNEYFETVPMNWATVLPLFDRHNRVCGIVLFEGLRTTDRVEDSFLHMRDLAVSAGRALGTSLYWEKHSSLQWAHGWINLRQRLIDTPRKQVWLKYGLPVLLVVGGLFLPLNYSIKGEANILPTQTFTQTVQSPSRLIEVNVLEGQAVTKGQILCRFETQEIELQMRQAQQEFERALVESDAALSLGNETQMQVARLAAVRARTALEKLRFDLDRAVLRAPFDGVVLGAQMLATRVGQMMRQGDPVLEIIDSRQWQVKVTLREQDLVFLEQRLREQGSVSAALKLAADPTKKHELLLNSESQLTYGLETSRGTYGFTAMLPLDSEMSDIVNLKTGFGGRVAFEGGVRPLAFILFRDFINFLRVRFV